MKIGKFGLIFFTCIVNLDTSLRTFNINELQYKNYMLMLVLTKSEKYKVCYLNKVPKKTAIFSIPTFAFSIC